MGLDSREPGRNVWPTLVMLSSYNAVPDQPVPEICCRPNCRPHSPFSPTGPIHSQRFLSIPRVHIRQYWLLSLLKFLRSWKLISSLYPFRAQVKRHFLLTAIPDGNWLSCHEYILTKTNNSCFFLAGFIIFCPVLLFVYIFSVLVSPSREGSLLFILKSPGLGQYAP